MQLWITPITSSLAMPSAAGELVFCPLRQASGILNAIIPFMSSVKTN